MRICGHTKNQPEAYNKKNTRDKLLPPTFNINVLVKAINYQFRSKDAIIKNAIVTIQHNTCGHDGNSK